jgi:branched-chain amino acid transport system substrate-binding protein
MSTEEDGVLRKSAMGVAAAVLLLSAACTSPDDEADTSELVVAASLELTGPSSDVGVAHERGLRLKMEQLNSSGLLRGRRLRLIVEDNQGTAATAANQATRFAGNPSVAAIVMGGCSECTIESVGVANDNRVPLISLASATQVTTPAESRRFIFKIGPNTTDGARALATEMTRSGVRTVALMTPKDVYGDDGRDLMTQEAAKAGLTVTGTGRFQTDLADVRDAARAAVAGKPGAVVIWSAPAQAGPVAAAVREAGHRGALFLDSGAAGSMFLSGPAAAVDGASLVFPQALAMDDVIATTPAKAARKQWFEDYTSRYGGYHGHSSFAADALALIVAAVNRIGRPDRLALRDVMESMETDGLSGPIRLTPANHSGLMPQALTVLVARGGRWRLLG